MKSTSWQKFCTYFFNFLKNHFRLLLVVLEVAPVRTILVIGPLKHVTSSVIWFSLVNKRGILFLLGPPSQDHPRHWTTETGDVISHWFSMVNKRGELFLIGRPSQDHPRNWPTETGDVISHWISWGQFNVILFLIGCPSQVHPHHWPTEKGDVISHWISFFNIMWYYFSLVAPFRNILIIGPLKQVTSLVIDFQCSIKGVNCFSLVAPVRTVLVIGPLKSPLPSVWYKLASHWSFLHIFLYKTIYLRCNLILMISTQNK